VVPQDEQPETGSLKCASRIRKCVFFKIFLIVLFQSINIFDEMYLR
jgi:hypothetical protein